MTHTPCRWPEWDQLKTIDFCFWRHRLSDIIITCLHVRCWWCRYADIWEELTKHTVAMAADQKNTLLLMSVFIVGPQWKDWPHGITSQNQNKYMKRWEEHILDYTISQRSHTTRLQRNRNLLLSNRSKWRDFSM